MKYLLLACVVLMVASCANKGFFDSKPNEAAEVKSTDKVLDQVTCSGFKSWNDCYAKANASCSAGIFVVSREESLIQQKRVLTYKCQ